MWSYYQTSLNNYIYFLLVKVHEFLLQRQKPNYLDTRGMESDLWCFSCRKHLDCAIAKVRKCRKTLVQEIYLHWMFINTELTVFTMYQYMLALCLSCQGGAQRYRSLWTSFVIKRPAGARSRRSKLQFLRSSLLPSRSPALCRGPSSFHCKRNIDLQVLFIHILNLPSEWSEVSVHPSIHFFQTLRQNKTFWPLPLSAYLNNVIYFLF